MGARSPLLRSSVLRNPLHTGALRALAAVLMLLSLVACSPISSPPVQSQFPESETDGHSPTDNAGDSASSPESPLETVAVQVVGEELVVAQPPATTLAPDADGGFRLRSTLVGPGLLRYTFDAPEGAVVDVARDRSVAVVGADGDLYAGLAAPVVTAADGTELDTRWSTVEDATDLTLDLDPAADGSEPTEVAYPVTVDIHLGSAVVAGVEWGEREGGRSLALTPTAWGRASGSTGRAYGWSDVVRLEPSADTGVMKNQFLCHLDGARQKDTWNLEPWRPDLPFLDYVLARCNPT